MFIQWGDCLRSFYVWCPGVWSAAVILFKEEHKHQNLSAVRGWFISSPAQMTPLFWCVMIKQEHRAFVLQTWCVSTCRTHTFPFTSDSFSQVTWTKVLTEVSASSASRQTGLLPPSCCGAGRIISMQTFHCELFVTTMRADKAPCCSWPDCRLAENILILIFSCGSDSAGRQTGRGNGPMSERPVSPCL